MNQKVAGNGILKENKKNWIEISVFAALVAIASAVTFWLFYRQCVESMLGTGLYHSDMKAYILEMQGLDSGYSFPYPVLFKLAATIHLVTASFTGGAELAMALATMLLNSGAMIALKVMLDKHVGAKLQEAMPGKPWLPGILTGTAAVSLFFVSMVYPPTGIYLPGIKYKYLGVFTPNPFQQCPPIWRHSRSQFLHFLSMVNCCRCMSSQMRSESIREIIFCLQYICCWRP